MPSKPFLRFREPGLVTRNKGLERKWCSVSQAPAPKPLKTKESIC